MIQTLGSNLPLPNLPGRPYFLIAAILGTIILYIMAWAYPTFPGDESLLLRFQSLRSGWLDDTAKGFGNIGLVGVFMPVAAFLMAFLLMARRYADVAMVFAGLLVIGLGNWLKIVVDRPRPDHQIFDSVHSSLSFPSGHTLLAVVLGGLLIYMLESAVKPVLVRRAIQIGLALIVIAMGASRVYMGVHWPSDVVGAYVFGVLAVLGLIGLRKTVASAP